MWREGLGWALRGSLQQVGRVGPARQALHRLSVMTRGAGVAFLRCRRLVPDSERGQAHPDRRRGSATTPKELAAALRAAQKTLRFVHLGEALSALSRGSRLDQGLCVLTFDESFQSTADLALPVLRELGVPATFFVTTGPLGPDPAPVSAPLSTDDGDAVASPVIPDADLWHSLWDCQVHSVVDAVAPLPLQVGFVDRSLKTSTPKDRQQTVHRLLLSLASLDEKELAARLRALRDLAGGTPPLRPLDRMLTAEKLVQLSREPLVSIGAHGHAHLSLAAASDEALAAELHEPRERLRRLCGSAFVDVVSYPFGRPPYVDDRVIRAAVDAGYRAGFTALPGVARPGDHLFRLPRLALDRRSTGITAYELAGTLAAVDELLLLATGEEQRVDEAPEG